MGCDKDGSVLGKGVKGRHGACGVDGLGDLNAVCCGVGGIAGGWARVTGSSPDESDSLSDSGDWWLPDGTGIDCVNFNSFAGN